ncbi:Uncharacterized protein ALO87_05386 [Pseudomonas syringae pv. apii]|nr:Uncharacterized protein ALO87_05386 [Pseudomonas syringae pv. apii]
MVRRREWRCSIARMMSPVWLMRPLLRSLQMISVTAMADSSTAHAKTLPSGDGSTRLAATAMTQTAISKTNNLSISRIIFLMDPFIESSTTDNRVFLSSALTAKSAVYRQTGFSAALRG